MRVRVRRQRRAAPAVRRGGGAGQRGRAASAAAPAAAPAIEVGGALDPAERAADRLAARVLGPAPARGAAAAPGAGAVRRMCADCEDEKREARRLPARSPALAPGAAPAPAPAPAAAALAGLGAGDPLAPAERRFFEPRFGRDLGEVRLHEGAPAERAARALDARAFAHGRDIGFAAGARDRPTLAHELAHVVADDGRTRRQVPPEAAPAPAPAPRQPHVLTEAERRAARAYDERRFEDPFTIVIARETMGIARYPGAIDDAFIDAVAAWQFDHGETEDGKFGPVTTRSVVAAMLAAGEQRFADLLRGDNWVRADDTFAPTFGPCPGGPPGTPFVGFRWEVAFRTSLRGGFIVQRLDNTWAENPAPVSGVAPPTLRYWEAWPVNAAGAVTHPKFAGGGDDRWQRAIHNNSRGRWTMAGTLYTVLNLPAQFAAPGGANHAPDAGGLRSALALNAASIDSLGLPEGFAAIQLGDERARRAGGEWDCTAAVPFNRRI